jgi:hypothetical protein
LLISSPAHYYEFKCVSMWVVLKSWGPALGGGDSEGAGQGDRKTEDLP